MNNRHYTTRITHLHGVTLIEVLISIGVLGVGLLGVAAIFPVGSYYTVKGDISDRGSAVAQAAFADFVASGSSDPSGWMSWYDANRGGGYFTGDPSIDSTPGQYGPIGVPIRDFLVLQNSGMGVAATAAPRAYNSDFGSAYIIDPLGMAEGENLNLNRTALSSAPYGATVAATVRPIDTQRWQPFSGSWPVRRLTLGRAMQRDAQGDPTLPDLPASREQFTSGDDLAITDLDADRPARGQFSGLDSTGDGIVDVPLRRKEKGNYSWIVTIAPSNAAALVALATDPSAYYYDVSVVVFFQRAVNTINTSERLTRGKVVATGTGGGEVLLERLNDGIPESPFKELKVGQWVMVTGPHPNSTEIQPMLFTQWYRVLAISDKNELPITDEVNQRLVGLRGPDWPWDFDDQVSVGLFPGAVAVHTKTMRLDDRGVWQY